MNRILINAAVVVVLACLVAWRGWSATISLSVGVGGVIGLANLWLWQRVVAGMVAHRRGGPITGPALAMRMVVKLVPLIALLVVIFRGSFHPVGVMVGFGSALFGLVWSGFTGTGRDESPSEHQTRNGV